MIDLKNIKVGVKPVVMECNVKKARELWHSNVSLKDRRKYEFVAESTGTNICEVSLQNWVDQPHLRVDDCVSGWRSALVYGLITVVSTIIMWGVVKTWIL